MSRVSTYLNFMGNTEEAFSFYGSIFATAPGDQIARMGDMPSGPGMPELSDAEKRMVAHMELPILADHVLMGTDMLESMGHQLRIGNNITINLEPDTRAETDWREYGSQFCASIRASVALRQPRNNSVPTKTQVGSGPARVRPVIEKGWPTSPAERSSPSHGCGLPFARLGTRDPDFAPCGFAEPKNEEWW